MSDFKENIATFARQFVPSHRFIRTHESTLGNIHELQTELNHHSIKVLNWNIAKNNFEKTWFKDFYRILRQHQPDLICFQEVRMGVGLEQIIGFNKFSWAYAPNFIDAHHQTYSGILTAANISPLTKKAIVTKHYEPLVNTPKVSLITEYSLANQQKTLLTINSHLINFVEINKFKIQLQEIELALSTHRGPIIFSGDFNTWNRQRAIILDKAVTKLGLKQVKFATHERKKIKRFLLSPPLDYIFYRGLTEKPASAKVLDEICSSDHKPLLAEFSYVDT
ncbi:endonuclease/exonuclease/phosphatase family protein [Nostoc sp. LEGE 06077]|uniref:endonuclease/exonuclease/phosphatase family protein n=1 Tax=Nostoc sp. LEGE 06077 TaxID=915325 RepID=UPI00187F2D8D|nr:endonuclease/exonuclease/phosphatase family protein [Nostoc sp. LEGE 06077]MBE9207827.1 endonuclease/exonuclease/phosphatase family protein [Nostoc sp. LEGE 06077]